MEQLMILKHKLHLFNTPLLHFSHLVISFDVFGFR